MRKLCSALLFLPAMVALPSKSLADQPVRQSDLIEISIVTSRLQPVIGTGFQITAAIKNVSNKTVYIDGGHCTLTRPPEIQAGTGTVAGESATFPSTPNGNVPRMGIKPGETYNVVWLSDIPPEPPPGKSGLVKTASDLYAQIVWELQFLLFSPGDYRVIVQAYYWTDPSYPDDDFHVAAQTAIMHVVAPQSVILLGAAIGGLICFFLFRRHPLGSVPPEIETRNVGSGFAAALGVGRLLSNCVVVMLWSVIVTILLSRIADTQFFVKVSVSDFWGAIAVGFAANYLGMGILNRLLGDHKGTAGSDQEKKPDADENPKKDRATEEGTPAG